MSIALHNRVGECEARVKSLQNEVIALRKALADAMGEFREIQALLRSLTRENTPPKRAA